MDGFGEDAADLRAANAVVPSVVALSAQKSSPSVTAAIVAVASRLHGSGWRPERTLHDAAVDVLRELVAELLQAGRGSNFVYEAWAFATRGVPKASIHQVKPMKLGRFICLVVPPPDLMTIVHRLQRRSSGLGGFWRDFCMVRRDTVDEAWRRELEDEDPRSARSELLLEFICEALAGSPARVASMKGPFAPFMELVVRVGHRRAQAEPLPSQAAPNEHECTRPVGGNTTFLQCSCTAHSVNRQVRDSAPVDDTLRRKNHVMKDAIWQDDSTASAASVWSRHSDVASVGTSGHRRSNSGESILSSGSEIVGTCFHIEDAAASQATSLSHVATIRWLGLEPTEDSDTSRHW